MTTTYRDLSADSPAPFHQTESVSVVRALLHAASRAHVPFDDLLAAAGVDPALDDPEVRVPVSTVHWLWEEIPRRSGDEWFGLHAATTLPAGAMGILEYIVGTTDTLHDALQHIVTYSRVMSDALQMSLDSDRGVVTLHVQVVGTQARLPRHLAEFLVVRCVQICRELSQSNLRPLRVRLPHAPPSSGQALREYFGCDVEFHSHHLPQPTWRHTSVVFTASSLRTRVVHPDPQLGRLLRRYAERLLSSVPESPELMVRVRNALTQGLREGRVRLTHTAKALAMSPRTLQRRLAELGTTHEAIVDDMRSALATRYLRETDVSPIGLSGMLGFADPSTFYRAFRRWTGTTPTAYRKMKARTQSGIEVRQGASVVEIDDDTEAKTNPWIAIP